MSQDEDHKLVAEVTRAVRAADENFQKTGGSSRHWVRECFLPSMEAHDLLVLPRETLERAREALRLEIEHGRQPHGDPEWKLLAWHNMCAALADLDRLL